MVYDRYSPGSRFIVETNVRKTSFGEKSRPSSLVSVTCSIFKRNQEITQDADNVADLMTINPRVGALRTENYKRHESATAKERQRTMGSFPVCIGAGIRKKDGEGSYQATAVVRGAGIKAGGKLL